MAQVLIRDLDSQVVLKLKQRAENHGRSLEAELRQILQHAAGEPRVDWRDEVERVRRMFAGRDFSDSAELVRQDRDR